MTKADLRRMILSHLTVIDDTENPSEEQRQLVDLWIDGARSLLLERGICWWDEDDIPAAVSIPLTRYVSALCCGAFGRRGKGFEADEAPALAMIAGLKSSDQREEQRAEYY